MFDLHAVRQDRGGTTMGPDNRGPDAVSPSDLDRQKSLNLV